MDTLGCESGHECQNITLIQKQWAKFKILKPVDIIVVNSGAHWRADFDAAKHSFSLIAKTIREVFSGTLILRTTVMGHDQCEMHFGPVIDLDEDKRNQFAKRYNWKNFHDLNHVIVDAFQSHWKDRFYVLNISMFEQRADGHFLGPKRDCLHYCSPGVIDEWNRLLYHTLRKNGLV